MHIIHRQTCRVCALPEVTAVDENNIARKSKRRVRLTSWRSRMR
jgi:hypothetical protein